MAKFPVFLLFPSSTLSSGLNSLAAVTLEDIVKRIKPDIRDGTATLVTKFAGLQEALIICSATS